MDETLESTAPDEEHRFPCENCGSDLRFDPVSADLKCDHCGFQQELDAGGPKKEPITELDFRSAIALQLPAAEMEETRVSSCESCGAQVEFDKDVHAAECPFCATPIVTDSGTHRHIKPRGLLPFALQEHEAHDKMSDWLGGLWFAPSGLKAYARAGRKMSGIYVPYWTYDAETDSSYTGQRGDYYYVTETRMRDGKSEQVRVRKIRWSNRRGRVRRFFDDVLVLASKSLPKHYTDGLEPWDLADLQPYQPEYLAGLRAEGYQIDLEEGYEEARDKMDAQIRRDVRFDIGGDQQRIDQVNTQVSDVTFKHILLPVWMAAYKYRGKSYRFVVNGRSGRVQGERPYSTGKIIAAVVAGLIVAAAVGYLIAISQG